MPAVIPVKFTYVARDLWFDPVDSGAVEADHVICSTDRGEEIGLVTADSKEYTLEQIHEKTSGSPLKPVLRVATDEDLERAESLADKGDAALPVFRRLIEESKLDMKPVGVEYLFSGDKVVCYFAAEERVDFRQLVRDLSRELHERVDMRQIGVREEAGLRGGFGHCGQELCCARFGSGFDPVSIRMAKEQDLPLNSTKISGACGRLMCCLRYEFEAYRDFKGRAPKKNAVIQTPLGKAKIIEYDTPKEQLCLRLENGKQVRVPLSGMEASDAAHKKSEELGCPCRPDTVTRAALDAIESSDVKMALADLDRANGVIPQESFDESDIFVDRGSKHKRGNGGGRGNGNGGGNGNGNGGRKRQGASSGEASSASGDEQPKPRRRRRKSQGQASSQGDASQKQGQGSGEQHASRRRHHAASGDGTSEGKQQGTKQQGTKRARRPGDRGGATSGSATASDQGQTSKPQGDGTAPKRKRRHRGGRGHGNGSNGGNSQGGGQGSDGGTAPSAE